MNHFERLEPRILMDATGGGASQVAAEFEPTNGSIIRGDWDGDGTDDAGAFVRTRGTRGELRLDLNGDDAFQANERILISGITRPVVGDVDGDGIDEIGTYSNGMFRFDTNHDYRLNGRDLMARVGTRNHRDIAVHDFNQDGIDDLALRVPGSDWEVHYNDNTDYAGFARALRKAKVKFYGAFWCPHCADQKALFKTGARFLPYVECSTRDGQGQTRACELANISSYPTWEFADGTRLTGTQSLQTLSEQAGVAIPTARRPYSKQVDDTLTDLPQGVATDFDPLGGIRVCGDWDGDGSANEGAFIPHRVGAGEFLLDLNGDGLLQAGERFDARGVINPTFGDINGDGTDEIGAYRSGSFIFDTSGDHQLGRGDVTARVGTGRHTDFHVTDWNTDGHDDLIVRQPGRNWEVHLYDSVDYRRFAHDLRRAGVKFYGAFWCPHCAEQKELFKTGVRSLPYVECSTPDGNSQTAACQALGIQTYPTWVFPDGTRLTGVQQLSDLSLQAGIAIPQLRQPYSRFVDESVATIV